MTVVSKNFYSFLTLSPGLAMVIFYSLILRAYIVLGKFPIPYQPDPKDLNFNIHMWLVLISATFVYAAFLPWIFITAKLWQQKTFSKTFMTTCTALYAIFFAAFILIIKLDPGKFVEWFLD